MENIPGLTSFSDVNPLNFISEVFGSAEDIMQTFFWPREWMIRKNELKAGEITREEYLEWKLNWPETYDNNKTPLQWNTIIVKSKEIVNGEVHNRPCYYSFQDDDEKEIYWMIPVSSQTDKECSRKLFVPGFVR